MFEDHYSKVPRKTFFMKVGDGHELWVDVRGHEKDPPLISLHGGPGSPLNPTQNRLIPPGYRLINFHQRGAGLSRPRGSLRKNTTKDLIKDIEKIRKKLKIKRWVVMGSSWGATLALAYAETYPKKIKALILCGLSLMNDQRDRIFHHVAPDVFDKYMKKKTHLANARFYMPHLLRREKKWIDDWSYGSKLFKLMKFKKAIKDTKNPYERKWASAIIQCHYALHFGYVKNLLKRAKRIKNIPGAIFCGRGDHFVSPENSYKLSRIWKKAKLFLIANAGHRRTDKNIAVPLWNVLKKIKHV